MRNLLTAVVMMSSVAAAGQVQRFLPTSQVVMIASAAARDEGYNPDAENIFLDNLRTKDGKEPYPGYASIGLYVDDHLLRSYSIRIGTGDVLDATSCTIFRYPDLLRIKQGLLKSFGAKETSLDQIASEVGCDQLQVLTRRTKPGK